MIIVKTANKSLQKTQIALNSFSIIARHKGFSGIIGLSPADQDALSLRF